MSSFFGNAGLHVINHLALETFPLLYVTFETLANRPRNGGFRGWPLKANKGHRAYKTKRLLSSASKETLLAVLNMGLKKTIKKRFPSDQTPRHRLPLYQPINSDFSPFILMPGKTYTITTIG
jgi:hypothetical protein